jgi:sialidase-1
MKRLGLLFIPLLLLAGFLAAQPNPVTVFRSGEEGYATYRIPAIIRLHNGQLLAFCEGRVNGGADFGDIDIVMKRSSDGGKTWSALQVVAQAGSLQAGNPAPVVDQSDPAYPNGRVLLFYNTGNASEQDVRKGKGLREVWYTASADGGLHWSAPVNITLQTHRPNQPAINPAYHFPEDWRSYANTPGHALQLQWGPHRGRIYVAANHSAGGVRLNFGDYSSHGFYTDDHAASFHLSSSIPVKGSNESMAVENIPGRVMVQFRNQSGSPRLRGVAISADGGVTWDSMYNDPHLPDPICQGSILRVEDSRHHAAIICCNDADTLRRNNLTLSVSYDAGYTWAYKIPIDGSADLAPADYTSYSDLADLGHGRAGILYERNNYSEIVFKRVRWTSK